MMSSGGYANSKGEEQEGDKDEETSAIPRKILTDCRKLWRSYLQRINESQSTLIAADEIIQRLLFFVPLRDSDNSPQRWTEVLFGLLQLNRLSIDLAEQEIEDGRRTSSSSRANAHGASVAVGTPTTTTTDNFPAGGIRIALTIIQCLWPVAQQIVRGNTLQKTERRQSIIRCMLERVRFVLRMSLLINYWKQILQKQQQQTQKKQITTIKEEEEEDDDDDDGSDNNQQQQQQEPTILPGLMLNGGLYSEHPCAPTVEQERARWERMNYVGRRTGRKVHEAAGQRRQQQQGGESPQGETTGKSSSNSSNSSMLRMAVGEVFYVLRPLLQAEEQRRIVTSDNSPGEMMKKLGKLWISCLAMDVSSLIALKQGGDENDNNNNNNGMMLPWNSATREEWNRRRDRLWLYLLRSPIWDLYTQRTAQKISNAADYIPLLGGLIQNYLWDWLYYWKLYRAEEG